MPEKALAAKLAPRAEPVQPPDGRPRRPALPRGLRYEPTPKWIRAERGGEVVVDSRAALLVWLERQVVPPYAFPAGDVTLPTESANARTPTSRLELVHVAVAVHSIKDALRLYRDALGGEYLMGGDSRQLALAAGAVPGRRQGRAARAARRGLPLALPREARRGPAPRHLQDRRHRGGDRARALARLRAGRRQPRRRRTGRRRSCVPRARTGRCSSSRGRRAPTTRRAATCGRRTSRSCCPPSRPRRRGRAGPRRGALPRRAARRGRGRLAGARAQAGPRSTPCRPPRSRSRTTRSSTPAAARS